MRLPPEKIQEITGFKRKSAQVAWFRLHMGVDVPCDRAGPIMSDTAYELLLEKRLGVLASLPRQSGKPVPALRLIRACS